MSFLLGGGGSEHQRAHARDEFAKTRKRAELHLGRDVGDERAFSLEARSRRKLKLWPVWILAIVMVAGAFGLLPSGGDDDLATDCDRAAFRLSSYDVPPGDSIEVSATGPRSGTYVMVSGSGTVTETPDGLSVADGAVLSEPFEMTGCRVDVGMTAPTNEGTHTVRLMHKAAGGGYEEVAGAALTVG